MLSQKADELAGQAEHWTLANDSELCSLLEELNVSIKSRLDDAGKKLDAADLAVSRASTRVSDLNNRLALYANDQFIENRVCEDCPTTPSTSTKPKPKTEAERQEEAIQNVKEAVALGFKLLHGKFKRIDMRAEDFDEDDDPTFIPDPIFEPFDPHLARPLPFIIGTPEWTSSPSIGLLEPSQQEAEEKKADVIIGLPRVLKPGIGDASGDASSARVDSKPPSPVSSKASLSLASEKGKDPVLPAPPKGIAGSVKSDSSGLFADDSSDEFTFEGANREEQHEDEAAEESKNEEEQEKPAVPSFQTRGLDSRGLASLFTDSDSDDDLFTGPVSVPSKRIDRPVAVQRKEWHAEIPGTSSRPPLSIQKAITVTSAQKARPVTSAQKVPPAASVQKASPAKPIQNAVPVTSTQKVPPVASARKAPAAKPVQHAELITSTEKVPPVASARKAPPAKSVQKVVPVASAQNAPSVIAVQKASPAATAQKDLKMPKQFHPHKTSDLFSSSSTSDEEPSHNPLSNPEDRERSASPEFKNRLAQLIIAGPPGPGAPGRKPSKKLSKKAEAEKEAKLKISYRQKFTGRAKGPAARRPPTRHIVSVAEEKEEEPTPLEPEIEEEELVSGEEEEEEEEEEVEVTELPAVKTEVFYATKRVAEVPSEKTAAPPPKPPKVPRTVSETLEAKAKVAAAEEVEAKPEVAIVEEGEAKPEVAVVEEGEAKPEVAVVEEGEAKPEVAIVEEGEAKPEVAVVEEGEAKPEVAVAEEGEAKPEVAAIEEGVAEVIMKEVEAEGEGELEGLVAKPEESLIEAEGAEIIEPITSAEAELITEPVPPSEVESVAELVAPAQPKAIAKLTVQAEPEVVPESIAPAKIEPVADPTSSAELEPMHAVGGRQPKPGPLRRRQISTFPEARSRSTSSGEESPLAPRRSDSVKHVASPQPNQPTRTPKMRSIFGDSDEDDIFSTPASSKKTFAPPVPKIGGTDELTSKESTGLKAKSVDRASVPEVTDKKVIEHVHDTVAVDDTEAVLEIPQKKADEASVDMAKKIVAAPLKDAVSIDDNEAVLKAADQKAIKSSASKDPTSLSSKTSTSAVKPTKSLFDSDSDDDLFKATPGKESSSSEVLPEAASKSITVPEAEDQKSSSKVPSATDSKPKRTGLFDDSDSDPEFLK